MLTRMVRGRGGLARAAAAAACVAITGWGALGLLASANISKNDNVYAGWQFAIGFTCVAVGTLVAYRAPRHPLGWILLVAAGAVMTSAAGSCVLQWTFERWHHATWSTRPLLLS